MGFEVALSSRSRRDSSSVAHGSRNGRQMLAEGQLVRLSIQEHDFCTSRGHASALFSTAALCCCEIDRKSSPRPPSSSHLTGGAGGRAAGPQTVFRTSSRAKATGLVCPRDPYQWLLVSGLVQFELWGERKHAKRTATLGEDNHTRTRTCMGLHHTTKHFFGTSMRRCAITTTSS